MSQSPANRFTPIYSIALILLALIGLVYLVSALPVELLGERRVRLVVWWVFPIIAALHLLYLLLSAEVWRRMVSILTEVQTEFTQAYLQMVAVAAGKYVPGKIWGIVARTGLMHRQQIPVHKSIMSSVIEQVLVLAGASIVTIGAGLVAFPEQAGLIGIVGFALLIGLAILTANVPLVTRWIISKQRVIEDPELIDEYSVIGVLRFTIAYAFLWLISGMIFAIIYFALFDVVVTVEQIAALVMANTIGFVAGFFALFAPGGLGVRETVTTAVLSPFLPVREVLLAAIVFRAWIVLFDGVNVVILLVCESRRSIKKHRISEC